MPSAVQQNEKENHRNHLCQMILQDLQIQETERNCTPVWPRFGGMEFPKEKIPHMTLPQIRANIDCLLDDGHLKDLFTKNGDPKIRWLPVCFGWMHNTINPVTSDFKCGKIKDEKELDIGQRYAIDQLKNKIVGQNFIKAKTKRQSDFQTDAAQCLGFVKSTIDNALFTETARPSQKKLVQAWEECLQDMSLVDHWAHGVWQKRNIAVAMA